MRQESPSVRQRFESAMEQRRQLCVYEQALAQTRRQIRAQNQAQDHIRDAIRLQEALVEQDQQALQAYERDTSSHTAMQQQAEHQQLLAQMRSQDEQIIRVQEQLQAQQQRHDQMRPR